jgi:hypothetical protein
MALVVLNLRGRRLDDHPLCRACSFDLVGLWPKAGNCPECGAALSTEAVRIGHRRRSRLRIASGVFLLLIGVSWAGVIGFSRASGFNWNTRKPVWWLKAEARSVTATTTSDAAVQELTRRLESGALPREPALALIERGLTAQASPGAAWSDAWGDYLEVARLQNLMSESQVGSYLRQAATPVLAIRRTGQAGRETKLEVTISGARIGSNSPFLLRVTRLDAGAFEGPAGATPLPPLPRHNAAYLALRPSGHSSSSRFVTLPALPGAYTVRETLRLSVRQTYDADEPALLEWDEEVIASFDVVPADVEVVRLVPDDKVQEVLQAAITVEPPVIKPRPTGESRQPIEWRVNLADPPRSVAFAVFVRLPAPDLAGGIREVQVGSVAVAAGGHHGFFFQSDGPEFSLDRIDVVLRSSAEAAHRTVELTEVWDGDIILRDIPVTRAVGEGSP